MDDTPRYTDFAEAIAALRALPLTFAPGADDAALAALQEAVGDADIAPILALYRDHDGFSRQGWPENDPEFARPWGPRFYLMPIAEALEMRGEIVEGWGETPEEASLYRELLPCWTDTANYMCLYLSGPLRGRIGYLWHEEPYFIQPLFRDVPAFLADLVREVRTGDNAFDYPCDTPRPVWDDEDAALCQAFVARYLSAEHPVVQENCAWNAVYLCPPDRLDLLEPLEANPCEFGSYAPLREKIADRRVTLP